MISRVYKHAAPNGARIKDPRRTNNQKATAFAHVLILLLSCAALTLGLGPSQLAKLKSFSTSDSPDLHKLDGKYVEQAVSLRSFLSFPRVTQSNRLRYIIDSAVRPSLTSLPAAKPNGISLPPIAPVNIFTVTT